MRKHYTTKRLKLKTLDSTASNMVLDFYQRNKLFFAPYDPLRNMGFYTLGHQKQTLTIEQTSMDMLNMLRLWIFDIEDTNCDYPIGNLAFTNIIRGIFSSCFLGYKLDEHYINRGYMSEALNEGIRIMFEDYRIHRIEANIMPKNEPSLAMIRKIGFYHEGLAKSYLKINDIWEDHIHMVLLNDENYPRTPR